MYLYVRIVVLKSDLIFKKFSKEKLNAENVIKEFSDL